jgi:hypothetical protein
LYDPIISRSLIKRGGVTRGCLAGFVLVLVVVIVLDGGAMEWRGVE